MSAMIELQERLQNTNALIARYENAITNPDSSGQVKSLAANVRALQALQKRLEAEYLELAAIQELEVYRYRIIQEEEEIPTLAGIADAWAKFQTFFGAVYSSLTKAQPTLGKKPPTSVQVPQLGYGYCFQGSVGVVVTIPKKPIDVALYAKSPVDEASAIVFDLIESKDIQRIGRLLGPEPLEAMNSWIDTHVQHHYGVGLEWHSDYTIKRAATVRYAELKTLQSVIVDTSTTTELIVEGELKAVDTISNTFILKSDSDETYEGTFESAISPEQAASVPARYKATILKTAGMVRTKKKEKPTYVLQKIEPLW